MVSRFSRLLYPKVKVLVAQLCLTVCNPTDYNLPGSSVHGDSPGKNTRMCSHFFLQRIFLILGSNPGLLHCRLILYRLSHQGSHVCCRIRHDLVTEQQQQQKQQSYILKVFFFFVNYKEKMWDSGSNLGTERGTGRKTD